MFTKTTFALATASDALAATKQQSFQPALATASGASNSVAPSRDAYLSYNRDAAYIGTDPDRNIQFELNRDRTHRVGQ